MNTQAQSVKGNSDELPFKEIKTYPKNYMAGSMISRMIDGLGYRFYWATEGLTEKELNYRPSKDASSVLETIKHIHGLAATVLQASKGEPATKPKGFDQREFKQLRREILETLQEASAAYNGKFGSEIEQMKVVFQRGEKRNEFPIWHLLNGQLADALYHTGQIVSFRRTCGNPLNGKVSVFMGKNRP